jgi:hypothetical protein
MFYGRKYTCANGGVILVLETSLATSQANALYSRSIKRHAMPVGFNQWPVEILDIKRIQSIIDIKYE